MSKAIIAKNSHDPTVTGDHREITATDITQDDGNVKRGMDVKIKQSGGIEDYVDVIQHSHEDTGMMLFSTTLTASQDFILVDISNTTDYHHVSTDYIHIDNWSLDIDATTNANYTLEIGYLENVDGTNGDFTSINEESGSNKLGVNKSVNYIPYPNGPRCQSTWFTSSIKSLNDTAFQTDVNLASTLDPSTADTPSGDGDLVLRAVVSAGTITVGLRISYHTH